MPAPFPPNTTNENVTKTKKCSQKGTRGRMGRKRTNNNQQLEAQTFGGTSNSAMVNINENGQQRAAGIGENGEKKKKRKRRVLLYVFQKH